MPRYQIVENTSLPGACTRRVAQFLSDNGIQSIPDVDTWLTANVTNIAQARVVLRELIIALVQLSTDGEPTLPTGL